MALLNGNQNVVILKDTPDYCVYSLNGNNICLFVVPNKVNNNLSLYLDINYKSDYDKLRTNSITQGDVVGKVEDIYKLLSREYADSVYVLPDFNVMELESKINSANFDKQQVFTLIGSIAEDTKKIQGVLANSGIRLDTTVINILEHTEVDKWLANFLKSQDIGNGISFSQLQNKENMNISSNPFMATGVGQEVVNPFNANQMATGQTVTPVPNNPVSTMNGLNNNQSIPSINNNQPNTMTTQTVPAPSALNPTSLSESNQQNINEQINEQNASLDHPKVRSRKLNSRGYVNIVILMAVLVGVTIVSIQLGKFLYSVYG